MIICRRPIEAFLLVLTVVVAALTGAPGGGLAAELKVEAMVIETASGPHSFQTEIADTDPTRARGLMFRRHMAGDHAMLFVWGAPIEAAMWMKNTYIPLDMLFINAEGRVVKIVASTTPESLDTIDSGQSVRAVIELNAGVAGKLHLRAGSLVIHPAFPAR